MNEIIFEPNPYIHKVLIYLSTTVYVPSSELRLPQPLSRKRMCPSLRTKGWGGHTCLRVGESHFRRLEKKLSTLPTLCLYQNPSSISSFKNSSSSCLFRAFLLSSPSLLTSCPRFNSFSLLRNYIPSILFRNIFAPPPPGSWLQTEEIDISIHTSKNKTLAGLQLG